MGAIAEFALFTESDKELARHHGSTVTDVGLDPSRRAALHVQTLQTRAVLTFVAVNAVEVAVHQGGGIHLGGESRGFSRLSSGSVAGFVVGEAQQVFRPCRSRSRSSR